MTSPGRDPQPARFGPLVDARWLAANLASPGMRIIDFRWELGRGSRHDLYLSGHLPGAVFVPLESVTGETGPGRHPLPAAAVFGAAMRSAGVDVDSRVVVYDASGGFSAARLWWLLQHFGHHAVAVLDGGLPAWRGPLDSGEVDVQPGNFRALEGRDDVVDATRAARLRDDDVLLDARVAERYRGDVEPVDPRAGHVPGAVNVPWGANLRADQRFLDPGALRALYEAAGVRAGRNTIVYCGSGITACVDLLGLAVAGHAPGLLYEGSWSDWSTRPELPLATGEAPGGNQPKGHQQE